MISVLGIDTSNYTTSAALYTGGEVIQNKKLLPVKSGTLGLRQSDAIFHHTQQLPEIINGLMSNSSADIKAVGASVTPRNIKGSYMPCFTVGGGAAKILSSVMKIPFYGFSHQQGHIAAALFSAGKLQLLKKEFLAFHVSGGTTEALIACGDANNIINTKLAASTLDLNAGQLVDRAGVMMGLDFPCGKELEKLALLCNESVKVKSTLKGSNCCLSGVENQCRKIFEESNSKEKTALYVLKSIEQTLLDMCVEILKEHGKMPILFSGGVMSNSIIRNSLTEKLGAYFAEPEFSADNAAGIAVLTAVKENLVII